ncbi:NinB/ Orf homologous recombination mediator [Vibrio phage D184]
MFITYLNFAEIMTFAFPICATLTMGILINTKVGQGIRNNMAEITLIKDGAKLVPFAPDDAEILQKMANGQVIKAKYSIPRNLAFHRKYFALINLGFEYTKPSFNLVTNQERHGIYGFAKFLDNAAERQDELLKSMASEYIAKLEKDRLTRFGEPQPCKTEFRRNVMIKAGFYNLVSTPDGPAKVAESISFGSMDNDRFAKVYNGCFNILWVDVLNAVFESKEDAEEAVMQTMSQLLSYA